MKSFHSYLILNTFFAIAGPGLAGTFHSLTSTLFLHSNSPRMRDRTKKWRVRTNHYNYKIYIYITYNYKIIPLTLLGIILILFHWCLLLFCLSWPVIDDGLCVATVHKLLTLCAMAEPSAASWRSGPCPAWMFHLPSVPTCFLQLGSIHSESSSVEQVSGKMPLPSALLYKCPLDLGLTCLCQA